MDLTRVILGPVVTEKAERLKVADHIYVLRIAHAATKIEARKALEKYYDVTVERVSTVWTQPKSRVIGQGKRMEKRHRERRALVKLAKKSKPLDLAYFKTVS